MANGWSYFNWPYAYCMANGSWYYINEVDTQWVVRLGAGEWSRFGEHSVSANMVLVEGNAHNDSFYIGKYEVTWSEWVDVRDWAANNGYDLAGIGEGCGPDHPVRSVNWYDSVKWCNALSEKERVTPVYTVSGNIYRTGEHDVVEAVASADGYRLPTPSEWIYAARGGAVDEGFTYAGGNTLADVGWYFGNSAGAACDISGTRGTWPVGQKAPNRLGLYDMSGNVREFCFGNSYGYVETRSGSWAAQDWAALISADTGVWAVDRVYDRGLRVVRNAP